MPAVSGATAQGRGCMADPDQNRIEMGVPTAAGNTQHIDLPTHP
jgi:hypothetical protein